MFSLSILRMYFWKFLTFSQLTNTIVAVHPGIAMNVGDILAKPSLRKVQLALFSYFYRVRMSMTKII